MAREHVNQLIARVMQKYHGESPSALALFFEAVHQELAPLARELEAENAQLLAQVAELEREIGLRGVK